MRAKFFILLLGCGGQTQGVVIPPSSSDFPPPASDAVPYDPRIGLLVDVPGGLARIGSWQAQPSLALNPLACTANAEGALNGEVVVAPFRLMTTEVTNTAYRLCVEANACTVPDIPYEGPDGLPTWGSLSAANQPVILSWGLARAFCRHYGGDLPTAGEYARASVGDDEGYAPSPALVKWRGCVTAGVSTPECAHFDLFVQGNGSSYLVLDVGMDPSDRGPYGHYDLFANALEWARGTYDVATKWCQSPLYEHDIINIQPASNNQLLYFPMGTLSAWYTDNPGAPASVAAEQYSKLPLVGPTYPPVGFRCAFTTGG